MKIKEFLKDKVISIVILLFTLFTVEILLMLYNFGLEIKIYVFVSVLLAYFIGISIEYFNKKRYYDNLKELLDDLEQKYLLSEVINKPNFSEGKIFYDVLSQVDKSMLENVNKYKYLQEEYKDYIELWIHEIKIPIATSKLIIENNKNSVTKSIDEELDKIDDFTEQALFYARSNTVEKDYIIKRVNLKDIVNNVIKKNKNILIASKIKVNIKDVNREIFIDGKWITFIINQIISNSIKYSKKTEKAIDIYSKTSKDGTILYIKDNGIGIKEAEVSRVFEKGFTGTNGRKIGKKSTGIGLYLCKKLCNKLGIGISLSSCEGIGTEVKVMFPKNSYVSF